ncbi:MAG: beta strand repeat-containing protein, partial [Anaerolineales bacterium]
GKGAFLHNFGSSSPKNIIINGTNVFNNNASAGLLTLGWGSVTVNNITANDNGCDLTYEGDAFYCAGVYLEGQRGITLTGYGRFENNTHRGLSVYAGGTGLVTLNNLYASNNNDIGVRVYAIGSSALNVTLKGINNFLLNGADGLAVVSTGAITLSNVTANSNSGDGAYLDNLFAAAPKSVFLLGANNFNQNGNGLVIRTNGAVTLNNLTANVNALNGVDIENITAPTPQAVTLKGVNVFNDNGGSGLLIYANGAITLSNLTALSNTAYGASLNNESVPTSPSNVTISGSNMFENNDIGLFIKSYGAVALSNLTANYSTSPFGYGVYVHNSGGTMAKSVTLSGTNMINNNSGVAGLFIVSLGAIKVNNVMANYNSGVGARLDNNNISTVSQPVTISGYGIFNENAGTGLFVETNGNVVFANITAKGNGLSGASIEAVNSVTSASFANVTFTGVNTFNGNASGNGLSIVTDGAITISNLTANGNANYGATIDNLTNANSGPTGIKAVTLSGTNMFNNNLYDGLYIYASGNVTLTRITANNNNDLLVGAPQSYGVYVYSTLGNIAFTCGSLNNNEGRGYSLNVAGIGKTITLKGVYTFGNGLANFTSGATPSITRACPLP